MLKSRIPAAVALTISLFLPLPAWAARGGPDREVAFRVLLFECRDDVISVLPPKGNPSKVVVPLYVGGFSELVTAKFNDDTAQFFVEEKEKGKKERKLVAEGPLATGARQIFIVVPTDQKTGPIYRIIAFDDGDGVFAMGTSRVLNLTPYPLRLNLAGEEQSPIKPKASSVYPICKKVDEWNMYSVTLDLQVENGKWHNVASQSWKASDRKRDWVIVKYNTETKEPQIQQYVDIPPWIDDPLNPDAQKASKSKSRK